MNSDRLCSRVRSHCIYWCLFLPITGWSLDPPSSSPHFPAFLSLLKFGSSYLLLWKKNNFFPSVFIPACHLIKFLWVCHFKMSAQVSKAQKVTRTQTLRHKHTHINTDTRSLDTPRTLKLGNSEFRILFQFWLVVAREVTDGSQVKMSLCPLHKVNANIASKEMKLFFLEWHGHIVNPLFLVRLSGGGHILL